MSADCLLTSNKVHIPLVQSRDVKGKNGMVSFRGALGKESRWANASCCCGVRKDGNGMVGKFSLGCFRRSKQYLVLTYFYTMNAKFLKQRRV